MIEFDYSRLKKIVIHYGFIMSFVLSTAMIYCFLMALIGNQSSTTIYINLFGESIIELVMIIFAIPSMALFFYMNYCLLKAI